MFSVPFLVENILKTYIWDRLKSQLVVLIYKQKLALLLKKTQTCKVALSALIDRSLNMWTISGPQPNKQSL